MGMTLVVCFVCQNGVLAVCVSQNRGFLCATSTVVGCVLPWQHCGWLCASTVVFCVFQHPGLLTVCCSQHCGLLCVARTVVPEMVGCVMPAPWFAVYPRNVVSCVLQAPWFAVCPRTEIGCVAVTLACCVLPALWLAVCCTNCGLLCVPSPWFAVCPSTMVCCNVVRTLVGCVFGQQYCLLCVPERFFGWVCPRTVVDCVLPVP